MKRRRLKPLLIGLAALLLIAGLVALPVVRELRQEAKDRALIAAIKRYDDSSVVELLNEGADANARELPKETRSVLRLGWDILLGRHAMDENAGRTPLLIAFTEPVPGISHPPQLIFVPHPHTRIVRALLEHGANPNVAGEEGFSPLSYGIVPGRTEIALLLLKHGAKMVQISNGKKEELFAQAAAEDNDTRVLQAMLDRGADINARDEIGMTALMYAIDGGSVAAVRFLLAHHANVGIKDNTHRTPFDHARDIVLDDSLHTARKQIIHLLRQAGAR